MKNAALLVMMVVVAARVSAQSPATPDGAILNCDTAAAASPELRSGRLRGSARVVGKGEAGPGHETGSHALPMGAHESAVQYRAARCAFRQRAGSALV